MKAEELDRRFDDGEDVLAFFDVANLKRPGLAKRPVNIDLPEWMLDALEKEAQGLGVSLQSIIELSLNEHLQTH
jgi:hypothetical protein